MTGSSVEHTLPFSACLMDGKLGLLCFCVHVLCALVGVDGQRGAASAVSPPQYSGHVLATSYASAVGTQTPMPR
jgi:hypothetical protein